MTKTPPDVVEAAAASMDALVAQIAPILKGHDPMLQGLVVANLVGMYLAGHDPLIRESMLELHIQTARSFIPKFASVMDPIRDKLKGKL